MQDQQNTAKEIERLANAWMTAVAERDASTLERILAAEFRLASGMGTFVDRATWLHASLNLIEGESFAYSDVTVRTYGEVTIMQSHWSQRARRGGRDWSGDGLLTDVWVWRDDRWQVVTRHSSLVTR